MDRIEPLNSYVDFLTPNTSERDSDLEMGSLKG